jgi:hypothetical protein
MIEIGRSLPNSTDPALTTGAALTLAFKALSSFRRDHGALQQADQPSKMSRSVFKRSGDRFASEKRVKSRI